MPKTKQPDISQIRVQIIGKYRTKLIQYLAKNKKDSQQETVQSKIKKYIDYLFLWHEAAEGFPEEMALEAIEADYLFNFNMLFELADLAGDEQLKNITSFVSVGMIDVESLKKAIGSLKQWRKS